MTPTARRLPPEQRRAQLAQAALAVAAEQGYAGLSLDDVGERAGVTRNLLYHYFPRGRLDVFLAALERAGDELTGDFIVDPGRPLAERLAANTDRAIEHASPRQRRLARLAPRPLGGRARDPGRPRALPRRAVIRGMALNHLGTDDPPPLARVGAARVPRLPPDRAGRVARQRPRPRGPARPARAHADRHGGGDAPPRPRRATSRARRAPARARARRRRPSCTPPAISRARATSSAVVPAPRLVSASVCLPEIAMPSGLPWPR